MDIGEGSHTSASAMSLSEEITILRKRVMEQIGLSHRPKRKPNGITKADLETMKSDDLLKRDFHSDAPLKKCITDITEIPASDGAYTGKHQTAYPALEGTINHSDRGTQYTSEACRQTIRKHHIHQSTNSAGGRCHENARCESMWARMKTEFPQLLK